jgi:hypothetical protein
VVPPCVIPIWRKISKKYLKNKKNAKKQRSKEKSGKKRKIIA